MVVPWLLYGCSSFKRIDFARVKKEMILMKLRVTTLPSSAILCIP